MKTQRRLKKNSLKKNETYKKYKHSGGKKNNNNNKTSKLKKVNCSPKPKGEINEFTCYTNK